MGKGFAWENFMQIDPMRLLDNHGRGIAWAANASFSRLHYYPPGNRVLAVVAHGESAGSDE